MPMRLDKYLRTAGLVKRRAVAKKLCDAGRVKLADRVAKAATTVAPGDLLEVCYGQKSIVVEVVDVGPGPTTRSERGERYRLKKEIFHA
jgi:ribosomal 50S subunit-recycling heat shock protein